MGERGETYLEVLEVEGEGQRGGGVGGRRHDSWAGRAEIWGVPFPSLVGGEGGRRNGMPAVSLPFVGRTGREMQNEMEKPATALSRH